MRAAILGSLLLSAASAQAASPLSVVGNWSATANQTTGVLSITGQGGGSALCKSISGTIFGSPIKGFYCPFTGRIVFARLLGAVPVQVYQAWVGTDALVDRMGGSFLVWDSTGGAPPTSPTTDFNFNATK